MKLNASWRARGVFCCVILELSQRFDCSSKGANPTRSTVRPIESRKRSKPRLAQIEPMTLISVIEALLFSAQKPLSAKEISEALRQAGDEDEFSPNEFAKAREPEVAAALQQL